ncbi:hypothetical protein GQF61_10485 [Sphingobacterium sp. DK4209]|uniref:Uncharacterized protein n=1 Tax=Sphingobacterium zhuxiongii TaxID=2662364 RepID=A0A5Q0QBK4_9SPHI|nr:MULTISPECIES: hypothetical protein [unclassified Sphingobacterium]MVZ66285.1 hypothetical protein [Sphingobacterium sp. DK4209]QGA25068.1 hypothetical protein GFH32_01455 [Sphingobacterium sp. dk4302]
MRIKISNITDLQSEIARLKGKKKEQERFLVDQYQLLKHKVEAPARIFNMVVSNVPGVDMVKGLVSGIGSLKGTKKSDWLTKTVQLGLPLVLNRTLLRNAGWLKKGLVLFASETAAREVNQTTVSSIIDKITSFVKPKKKKKKDKVADEIERTEVAPPLHPPMITAEESVQDNAYGIPKDSETY